MHDLVSGDRDPRFLRLNASSGKADDRNPDVCCHAVLSPGDLAPSLGAFPLSLCVLCHRWGSD